MGRDISVNASRDIILVVDALELRRSAISTLLAPLAQGWNATIIQVDATAALTSEVIPKMVLLVLGGQSFADETPRNLIAFLHHQYETAPVVVIAERDDPQEIIAAYKCGARGFLPMSLVPTVAIQALKFVAGGGSYFPPTALIPYSDPGRSSPNALRIRATVRASVQELELTERQWEVFDMLRQGKTNKAIAKQLGLRESTVKVHIRQIMRRLGAKNRTQVALAAQLMNRDDNEKR